MALDTLSHLPVLCVMAANAQDRVQAEQLAAEVQAVTSEAVRRARIDQGYTCERPVADVAGHGIPLEAILLPEAKEDLVLSRQH